MAQKNYRICVSCRQSFHKDQLWRVVRTHPSGQIQLDTGMGRSAYLCHQASCLQSAQKKKRLNRALRTNVPDDIYAQLSAKIVRQTASV
ncbi:MAG: YlxR family protein [Cyanobacteria bacterium J06588_5]